jgi:hypothetical protein
MSDLSVIWSPTRDEKSVQEQLQKLDSHLFLDKERDRRTGGLVWVVRHWLGSATPPPVVLEWRDDRGDPLPLSTGIVYEVEKRKANFGRDLAADAAAANDALERRRESEAAAEYEEIAAEISRRRTLGSSTILHRSRALMFSRARAREAKAEQKRVNEQAMALELDLLRRKRERR